MAMDAFFMCLDNGIYLKKMFYCFLSKKKLLKNNLDKEAKTEKKNRSREASRD